MRTRRYLLNFQLFFIGCLCSLCSFATTFPNKPVTIVVPFPAGGSTDIMAREISKGLAQKWKQAVIIQNKNGAAGVVGSEYVSKAQPDGYTLLMSGVGNFSIVPILYKNLPYDPEKSFTPIGAIAQFPYVVLVAPNFRIKSLQELVNYAKNHPGEVTYSSPGNGNGAHLAAEIFSNAADITLLHIPFRGGEPAMEALMAGQVNLYFAPALEAVNRVASNQVQALAQSGSIRSKALNSVPTISESGYSGFNMNSWIGLVAPSGTPLNIVNQISEDLIEVMNDPKTRDWIAKRGANTLTLTPSNFRMLIEKDKQRFKNEIIRLNIKID